MRRPLCRFSAPLLLLRPQLGTDALSGVENVDGTESADVIIGNGGANVLWGREGGDLLTGGGGADRFDYDSPFDTYPAMADVITDFSRAQGDKIDLSTLDANLEVSGNQAFQFIGAAPFTAAGQLRAVTSGGGTAIELNISDAPVGADLVIVLSSTVPMQATDFVL